MEPSEPCSPSPKGVQAFRYFELQVIKRIENDVIIMLTTHVYIPFAAVSLFFLGATVGSSIPRVFNTSEMESI